MAEALLRHLAPDRVEAASAGTVATRVHPLAIAAMAEKGIGVSTQRSKLMDDLFEERFDYVVTVCDNARESCPVFPGAPKRLHWSLPDPSAVEGSEEVKLQAFRSTADELMGRIRLLIARIEGEDG
jgi:arsenate reductase